MLVLALLAAASFAANSPLPPGLKFALEHQLQAWGQVTGNSARASDSMERIAVEVADTEMSVFLIDRRLELDMHKIDNRYWIENARWCDGESWRGRCEKVWDRSDLAWKADTTGFYKRGYKVYRDTLNPVEASWNDPVPRMVSTKREWDRGVCQNGLCFLVSRKDSSVGRASVKPDGSILWWDGGCIKGIPNEDEMVRAYKYLLGQGKTIPYKSASIYPGQTVATWYDPAIPAEAAKTSTAKAAARKLLSQGFTRFIVDSTYPLLERAGQLKNAKGAKRLSASALDRIVASMSGWKTVARRIADTIECTGLARKQVKYSNGAEALLSEGVPDVLILQDSSLSALGVAAGDSAESVRRKLGTPSREGGGMMLYRSTQPDKSQEEYYDALWEVVLVFKDGRLLKAVLVRHFEDC